jgi:hypothetical protein
VKKIGNIVTKSKKNTFGDIFNVVKSFDDIIEGIPTLIIGFEEAKEWIENFNIIDKQYGDIWWTFKKTERRCEYEEDVIKFYNYAILHEMEKTKYVYVDLINFRLASIKKMIKFLGDGTKKYVFLTRNSHFMFVYSEVYNTVFGISLELCEYLGVAKQKVYKLLRNQEYIHDTKFIGSDIRKVIGSNTHYILPLYTYLN